MRMAFLAGVAAALTLFPVVQAGDSKSKDWPQWRGPNRDAVSTETGLLNEWPDGGPKLLWNSKDVNKGLNVGRGYSSVVIADGRIFTMGDRAKKGHLIALEQATGKLLWATPISEEYGDGGPRCTPTIDGKFVYGLSPQGNLACLDTSSGGLVWAKDLKKDFKGRMMSGWNYSESPTIDGDHLICTPGGVEACVIALNKRTGDVVWKCAAPKDKKGKSTDAGAGYASIVFAEVGGARQYITLLGPELGLVGVDAKTGKFLWNYRKIGNGTANIPTPLVKGDYVFTSTGYGTGSALLKLIPDGNGGCDAKEEYFLKGDKLQNHHGGMVMLGDYVYGGHGHNNGLPFCLEWKTGKMVWGPERGAGDGSAAVLYADGNLYFRWDNNIVGLVEASPKAYNLRSSFSLPKGTSNPGWQHLVVLDGRLYVRSNDQVLCYDIKK
jgi:outer membrane protein assembly factor BamB